MPGGETAPLRGRSRGGCIALGGLNVALTYETLRALTKRCRECWRMSINRVD
jgi:hypothetical protein